MFVNIAVDFGYLSFMVMVTNSFLTQNFANSVHISLKMSASFVGKFGHHKELLQCQGEKCSMRLERCQMDINSSQKSLVGTGTFTEGGCPSKEETNPTGPAPMISHTNRSSPKSIYTPIECFLYNIAKYIKPADCPD